MQFALAGLCSDPILQELDVLHVEPAPDSRRLRVVVCPSSRDVHVDQVRQRLAAAYGLLREAVATTVRRRRAPELVFEVRLDDEVSS